MGLIKRAVTWGMLLALSFVLFGIAGTVLGRMPAHMKALDAKLEPVEYPTGPGPLQLKLSMTPYWELFTSSVATVQTEGGLTYSGDAEWPVNCDTGEVYTRYIDVTLPDRDTCAVFVALSITTGVHYIRAYFVIKPDTVEFYPHHITAPVLDDEPKTKPTGRHGFVVPGEFPDRDSLYGTYPRAYPETIAPFGTMKVFRADTSAEAQLRRMSILERHPLQDLPAQYYRVGDEQYVRYRGETEFRLIERLTPEQHKANWRRLKDSLNALPDDADIEVCMAVFDSTESLRARNLLGELPAPAAPGFYHLHVTKGMIDKLKDAGILVEVLFLDPHEHE